MILGKGLFQQDTHHQTVAAQAGVVLDDNGGHPARLCLGYHLQIGRTIEGHAGVPVIHKEAEILKSVPFRILL